MPSEPAPPGPILRTRTLRRPSFRGSTAAAEPKSSLNPPRINITTTATAPMSTAGIRTTINKMKSNNPPTNIWSGPPLRRPRSRSVEESRMVCQLNTMAEG